jgi:hypothetical protein
MRIRSIGTVATAVLVASVVLTISTDGVIAKPVTFSDLTTRQKRLVSGMVDLEANLDEVGARAATQSMNYFPTGDDGCPGTLGPNVKVNQNCLNVSDSDLQGRGQANNETSVAVDPFNPKHILASGNDYRRGDGNCYGAFSLDGGMSFADTTIPMGFTRGNAFGAARQYWQAGGDTSVGWDTRGNGYFSCQVFMRGAPPSSSKDLSSAFYVFRSTGNAGSSWNFPGRPVIESPDVAGTGLAPFEDKQLMTVDNHQGSPFQDRVYVTWTEFAADGTAYIFESFSNDYAQSFSKKVLVSSDSSLCPTTFGIPTPLGRCNENQFSQPFTASDGSLYVVWNNYNNALSNATDNRNQVLVVKSTDGGKTFGAPVKVADFFDLPDCPTYQGGQDPGRSCVPEKSSAMRSVFRAANYPSGGVNPQNQKQIVVSFGSYINAHSNETNGCIPDGLAADGNNKFIGVKTAGACNNHILVSVSNDAGTSFTGTTTDPRKLASATPAKRQQTSDQWFQWLAFTNGGKLAISYYDRQYGDDELTGNSDFSLSGSAGNDIGAGNFAVKRVTSSSLPLPTQFPNPQGNGTFWGDYTGVSAVNNDAFPTWSDTRGRDVFVCPGTGLPGTPPALCSATTASGLVANDQDIFMSKVDIPTP